MGAKQGSEPKYRIVNIHKELLGHLMKGEGLGYLIYEMDAVVQRIRYRSLSADADEICYLRQHGIELMPDSGKMDEKRKKSDLYNTIAVREFINENNTWELSFFVKNMFVSQIRMSLDEIKEMEKFGILCNEIVAELAWKEKMLARAWQEGKQTDCRAYLSLGPSPEIQTGLELVNYYIDLCHAGEECRWQVLQKKMEKFDIKKERYVQIDRVFGTVELFHSVFEDYVEYIYKDFRQLAEKYHWED